MGNQSDIREPIPGSADGLEYDIRALIPENGLGNDIRAPKPGTAD